MAMTGFICHDKYLKQTEKMTDEELGRLFRACMMYHANGTECELSGREGMAFDFIREDIDAAEKSHNEKCEVNRRNRMTAIEQKKEEKDDSITTDNDRERPITNVDNKIKENKSKDNKKTKDINIVPLKRFVPPTVDEVEIYCLERGNHVNPQRFVDYYQSKGWMIGKNAPMKDWRASVRLWERSEITKKEYQQEIEELQASGLPL